MIHITLPDGSQREFPGPVTVAEVAASIGTGLAKAALAGKVDGKVVDTDPAIVVEELSDPNHLIANAGDQHDRLGSQIERRGWRRIETDDKVLWGSEVHWPQANRQRNQRASERRRRGQVIRGASLAQAMQGRAQDGRVRLVFPI